MKSPKELSKKISREWQNLKLREKRLLNDTEWPLLFTIRKPLASDIITNLSSVRSHLFKWKEVRTGEVIWNKIGYRGISDPINVPITWEINSPEEWVAATRSQSARSEFKKISNVISSVDKIFHSLLIRQFYLIAEKSNDEIIKACQLALFLGPGCAQGSPLRAIPHGVDSKFYERNRQLIIKLLDIRFNNVVSDLGLEEFLGAINESDHWILLADPAKKNLPFKHLRIRGSELATVPLSANYILIIENESCLHHLPELEDTISILGAGLDLSWMKAQWLSDKKIAYWGDIDTWGFTMLARAREQRPFLTALLMGESLYSNYKSQSAVKEPKIANKVPPAQLNEQEKRLYLRLVDEDKGRLEQEFIPRQVVKNEILKWRKGPQHAVQNTSN